MELKNFRSLPPYPVIIFYPFNFSPSPLPNTLILHSFICVTGQPAACCESGPRGSLVARSSWVMFGLSFIMKCLCPHSCLGSVYNRQLLFLNFSVGRTSLLHLDLKYAESPCPVNVLPALTPLLCIPNLHRFTCVTGTRRCPLKSLFGFCHFLILVICTLHLFVLLFLFLPLVCLLYCFICQSV